MKEIDLHVDGLTLKATLFAEEHGTGPAALLIHGWESAQDRMFSVAEELVSRGYTCLTVDLRGHGKSEGDHKVYSREQFLRDVVAAYDLLAAQAGVDRSKIIAIGSSFGAYMCALLTAKRPLSGVVLRVPADYRDVGFDKPLYAQRGEWEHSHWKEKPHAADETASLRATHSFRGRVLIVESEKDELVPAATVRSYVSAADPDTVSHVIMKDTTHSISRHPDKRQEFARIIVDWLGVE